MDCIKDVLCGKYTLVGIKDFVTCAHPETILFVNDIPGITLKSAAAIANDEQRNGFNLLKDKIRLAHQIIFHKFPHILSGSFKFNAFIESAEVINFGTTTNTPEAAERGLVVRRWRSDLAKIFIEKLYIKVAESGIAYVKIKDGDHEEILEVSLLAGITNEVDVKYKCVNECVYITFDQADFTTYSCQIVDEGCSTCGTSGYKKRDLEIRGWDGSSETYNCFGMGVLANVQCYEEAIICQLLPRMAFMIWYQSGIEILDEYVNTDRVNAIATFTKDKALIKIEELRIKLAEEENDFKKSINQFIKNTTGECFSCEGTRISYGLPG